MDTKSSQWRPGPTVCRCCLTEGCYKDISTEYFWMGKREIYAEMLTDTFDLSISYSQTSGPGSNSRLICEPCIARLRDASEFKRQVQECEKSFVQHLAPTHQLPATKEDLSSFDKAVKEEDVKEEKRVSDDDFDDRMGFGAADEDDDDDLDDQPLTKYATKVPKKESVDLLDLIDNAKVVEKRKSSGKTKSSPPKRAKIKKDLAQASASKTVTAEKKRKADTGVDPVRRNAELLLKYTTVHPFRVNIRSILCVFCLDAFDDPQQFRAHMRADHTKFSMLMAFAKLQKSELVKVDYTDLSCRMCSRKYEDLDLVAKHLRQDHGKDVDTAAQLGVMPYLLEKDGWTCAVCKKGFPSLLHLNKHTTTHFSSFVCDVCGKSYVSTTGLLQHVRNTHQQSKPFCRRCKRAFPSTEAKKLHEKTDKRCMPYCCPECPERFINWEVKQRHLVEAHGCTKTTYQCTDCEVVSTDRRAFYEHYKMAHSQDCHVCVHCGLKFVSNSRLSRHLAKHAV